MLRHGYTCVMVCYWYTISCSKSCIDYTSYRLGAMNYSADTVILTSQFASSVPYLVVEDIVIVQAVV